MKAVKPNPQKTAIKGVPFLKQMLDDKKAISTHLLNGGKLADLKDKYKFVNPL